MADEDTRAMQMRVAGRAIREAKAALLFADSRAAALDRIEEAKRALALPAEAKRLDGQQLSRLLNAQMLAEQRD